MASNLEDNDDMIKKKLVNFLKLPKAHRWVFCEWFYSDLDRAIFEAENDFSLCLKQSFPRLKTTKLRRKQWCLLRSLIGKPRRCSDAFLAEERQMLEEKRQKLRLIQQRKIGEQELVELTDLPQEVPLPLTIGHRVYTHLTRPEQGVFIGTVAAIDPIEHTYRVVFDRPNLPSQTVADYEIRSVVPAVTMPLRLYLQTYRPKVPATATNTTTTTTLGMSPGLHSIFLQTPMYHRLTPSLSNVFMEDLNNPALSSVLMLQQPNCDPMLGSHLTASPFAFESSTSTSSNLFHQHQNKTQQQQKQQDHSTMANSTSLYRSIAGGTIIPPSAQQQEQEQQQQQQKEGDPVTTIMNGVLGGYPIQLLLMITRLSKILAVKREKIRELSDLNAEAERARATETALTKDFQLAYAVLVLDLERLNKDLGEYLNGVQRFCEDFATDFQIKVNKNELVMSVKNNGHSLLSSINENNNNNSEEDEEDSNSPTSSTHEQQQQQQSSDLISDMKLNYWRDSARLVNKKNRKRRMERSEESSDEEENDDDEETDEEDAAVACSSSHDGQQIEHNLNKINLNGNNGNGNGNNNNNKKSDVKIKSKRTLDLIIRLTSLLLQLKDYVNATGRESEAASSSSSSSSPSASQFLPFCTRAINESISEIKQSLSSKETVDLFEDRIQVHINHVQSVLCQYNKLHAFKHELDH